MDGEQKRREREDLLILQQTIQPELTRLEELILFHKPPDSDQDFDDYVDKAIYFRNILKRIESDLAKLSE
ncbi:hypothetical protein GCM10027423_63030 [Spirosoma arcticum]